MDREKILTDLAACAQAHGDEEGSGVESADIWHMFMTAFNLLTRRQVATFFKSDCMKSLLEVPEYKDFQIPPRTRKVKPPPAAWPPRIEARATSDDYHVKVQFDASPWFAQAGDPQILELARQGWNGCAAADAVAEFVAALRKRRSGPEPAALRHLFAYLELIKDDPSKEDVCGFECAIDEATAIVWLGVHRPILYRAMTEHASWVEQMLLMTDVQPDPATIESWTIFQRYEAAEWAWREHLAANDNEVDRVPEPDHVKALPRQKIGG